MILSLQIRYLFLLWLIVVPGPACKKKNLNTPPVTTFRPPVTNAPVNWQEHWFEHRQLVKQVFYDSSITVWFDSDVNPSIKWPNQTLHQIWDYTKKTYGSFGVGNDSVLHCIFHAGKYSGGHPATYMDGHHDYRNVIDVGSLNSNAWITGQGNDLDLAAHEVGHIVEGASKGVHRSPAFPIWKDSKWMEIYQYDLYLNLGWTADAQRWYNLMQAKADNFPRAGTRWFVDWFYPIYNGYGKTVVLNKFFTLLANHFPKQNWNNGKTMYPQYTRDLNMGEFVHFWSGAAGADLKTLALTAFGNNDEQGNDWTAQLTQAKNTFPAISY